MELLQNVESEVLGFLFILGMIAVGMLLTQIFTKLKKPLSSLGDDLPEILEACTNTNSKPNEQAEPACEVLYEMEHYSLKFLKIEDLWHPCLVIGDHQSPINDVSANAKFRNLFMETMLYLKVKKTNQMAVT